MLKKIFNWFKNLFSSEEVQSEMLDILQNNLNSPEIAELKDPSIINQAFEFVKELHNCDNLTSKQKQAIFNDKMLQYSSTIGKKLSTFVVNLLREMAYTTLKIALTQGVTLLLANGQRVSPNKNNCKEQPEQLELDLEPKA